MIDEGQHAACVDRWLERTANGLQPGELVQLFEKALGALWTATQTTLGEVTLTAIAERVVLNTSEQLPLFAALRVEPSGGIQFGGLRDNIASVPAAELREGIRHLLVEFLTVIGNLTAEILTPELHAELLKVGSGS